jgi:hypothetical protein
MAKPQPVYQVDRQKSKQRAKRLQSYLTKHVWDPNTERSWAAFKCASKQDCKASAVTSGASFHEAQGHAVGRCFDLSTAEGIPFRILVVPMEAGGGERYFGVNGRTEKVRESGRLPFARRIPHEEARNAHMKGVTLALRLALGLPYADRHGLPFFDHQMEQINFTDGTHDHLFECFAMANLLLCSAVLKEGSQKSLATSVMRANCVRHLVKTVEILEPTLVISQGWGLVDTLWESFGVTHPVDLNVADCYLADCDLNGNRFVWIALKHPTRLWRSINQSYFRETVVPAIKAARKRALKLAQTV